MCRKKRHKKKEKLGTMAVSGKGLPAGVGKSCPCHCIPFCAVCSVSVIIWENKKYTHKEQKCAFLKLKHRKREMRLITLPPQGLQPVPP